MEVLVLFRLSDDESGSMIHFWLADDGGGSTLSFGRGSF